MGVQITFEGQPPKYLTAPLYKLGRAADCDILLPENDAMVSRYHACIECDANSQWWIADSSTNGTFVNGEKLSGRHLLRSGDQIGIGRTQIGFSSSQTSMAATPASPAATPRATETVFVTQQELQAKILASPTPSAPIVTPPVLPPVPEVRQSTPALPIVHPLESELLVESLELPNDRGSFGEQISDEVQQKQCTRCRTEYSQYEEECPECGHVGFKLKSGAASSNLEPSNTPQMAATPFDRAVQQNGEARPLVSNVPAIAPAPTSPNGQSKNAVLTNGLLGVASAGCGAVMLFSFFLPWAQIQMFFISGNVSYAELCQLILRGVSESNDLAFKAIAQEPQILLFFLPIVAIFVTLSGVGVLLAGTANKLPAVARSVSTGVMLGCGGAVGLAAAFLLFFNLANAGINLTGILGPGFWLFTLASLVATVVGFGAGSLAPLLFGRGTQKR